MPQNWFYADAQNQQQGPVDDSGLVAAYQRGEVLSRTLVWHEGLPNWTPFSHVAAKLGVTLPSAPPSLPRTSTSTGKVQIVKPGKSSSALIIIIVVVFGLIAVMGILAAIAIPAYSDYTIRAKVVTARLQGMALRADVEDFYAREKRCPSNGEGTIKKADVYATQYISAIQVGALKDDERCAIQIVLKNIGSGVTEGAVLQMAMTADGTWSDSSTLPPKFLPISMRK
jgi:type IV pilus assembly protein PilA